MQTPPRPPRDADRDRRQAQRSTPESRARNAARMRARYADFRQRGVCIRCGAVRADSGLMCEKHRELNRRYAQQAARQRRAPQPESASSRA